MPQYFDNHKILSSLLFFFWRDSGAINDIAGGELSCIKLNPKPSKLSSLSSLHSNADSQVKGNFFFGIFKSIIFSDEFEINSSSISGEGPLKFPSGEEYGLKAILTSFGELEGPIIKAIWPS